MKLKEKEDVKGWGDENHNLNLRMGVNDPGDGLCFHRILYGFQGIRKYSCLFKTCCGLWIHRRTKKGICSSPTLFNHV